MSRVQYGGQKQYGFEESCVSIGQDQAPSTTYGYSVATPKMTMANARLDNGVYSLGSIPAKITDSRPEAVTPP